MRVCVCEHGGLPFLEQFLFLKFSLVPGLHFMLPVEMVCLLLATGGFAVPSWSTVIIAALMLQFQELHCLGLVIAWFSSCLLFSQVLIFSPIFKNEVISGLSHGHQQSWDLSLV